MLADVSGDPGDPGVALAGEEDFSKRDDDAVVAGVAGAGVECNVAGTGEQLVVTGFVQSDRGALPDIVESLGTPDISLAEAGSGD